MKIKLKNLLTDIRFWIVLFFLIRMVGITNAPLEIGHSWRQSLTNMIARNFVDYGVDMLRPAIDMAGEKTGIIGSEFPLFNYLIYLFAEIFGYDHWYGRLINLLISSIGIYYFYKLIKGLFSERVAFSAAIILTTSIWFGFSRKIMPDTFSVALMITGLYYAYDYLKYNRKRGLVLFFLLSTLGMLCKIPALSLFGALGIIIFIRTIPAIRKAWLIATGTVGFAIAGLWYFYWVPYLLQTYHYQLYFPKGITEGIKEIIPLLPLALEKFYFSSLMSYLAFACFLAGLVSIFISKNRLLKITLSIVTLVFVIFIIKTGAVFPLHSYYVIPFTPVMAFVAGYFLAKIPLKFQYILLVIIAIEAIANQQHDFFIKESENYKLQLETVADKTIGKHDLIIINGGPSPQQIYLSHRKGWTVESEKLYNPKFIDSLNNLGAKYLIIDKSLFKGEAIAYPNIFSDDNYEVYSLSKTE